MTDLTDDLKTLKKVLGAPRGTHALIIEINGGADDVGVWAYPTSVPGLVVHRTINNRGWTITHEPSSLAVRRGFQTKREAVQAASEIAEAASDMDFTRPGEDLMTGYIQSGPDGPVEVRSLLSRGDVLLPILQRYNGVY